MDEQFAGDIDEAHRAEYAEKEIPESGDSSWVASGGHVPSLFEV
jgi:CBS domain containing-hemolysin-like protein